MIMLAQTDPAAVPETTADAATTLYDIYLAARAGDVTPLTSLAVEYLVPGVLALLSLGICYFTAKFVARMISGPLCKRVDETLGRFAGKFAFYGIMTCAVIGVASTVGINVASFAALLAAAGFAIGMAFQGTLGNFAAGILLMVFRPFKVGDMINAAGVTGKVNEIDLFTTTLDTPDNRRIIVPNSSVAGNTIENITFHQHRRVEVAVGVSYHADVDATRQALTTAADSIRDLLVAGENRGYQVIMSQFGASSVDWIVRFWAPTPKFFQAKESLTVAIKRELDAANISIPFPQLDIHLDGQLEGAEMVLELPAPATDQSATRVRPRLRSRAS